MGLSAYLAKLLGLYFLIIAALWLIHKERVNQSVKDFMSSRGCIIFAGAFNIVAGLAIAIAHPVWELNWRGLISILAYIMIAHGILRFVYPDYVQKQGMNLINKGYWPIIGVLVVLGVILTYSGFML